MQVTVQNMQIRVLDRRKQFYIYYYAVWSTSGNVLCQVQSLQTLPRGKKEKWKPVKHCKHKQASSVWRQLKQTDVFSVDMIGSDVILFHTVWWVDTFKAVSCRFLPSVTRVPQRPRVRGESRANSTALRLGRGCARVAHKRGNWPSCMGRNSRKRALRETRLPVPSNALCCPASLCTNRLTGNQTVRWWLRLCR